MLNMNNIKSNAVYKKRELQLNEFTRKNYDVVRFWTWRRRWNKAYVKRDLFSVITYLCEVWDIAEQASICAYRTYTFIYFNDRSFR